jgi:hypothetical protein
MYPYKLCEEKALIEKALIEKALRKPGYPRLSAER